MPCVRKGLILHVDQKYRLRMECASVLPPPGKGTWVMKADFPLPGQTNREKEGGLGGEQQRAITFSV